MVWLGGRGGVLYILQAMESQEVGVEEKYLKRELLGSGGFAKCYLMVSQRTQERFAGKVVRRRELKDKQSRAKVLQESEIHRYWKEDAGTGSSSEVTEEPPRRAARRRLRVAGRVLHDHGALPEQQPQGYDHRHAEFLRSRVRLTEVEAKYYLAQLVGGLEYLHGEGVVHRDIKLGNIFLNYKMEIKIGDFGLSTRVKSARERRFTTCGTPNYIAPEILAESGHSFEVDVWAVGIVLYALLVGRPPFESETVDETYRRIRNNNFDFPKQVPVSGEAKALIRQLLDPNPRTRVTLQQVRTSDFLTAQKIPPTMPAYTISLPPQSSFLKQYGGDKGAKLAIYPRKVSTGGEDAHCSNSNGRQRPKLSRVLSCDKNIFKAGEKGSRDLSELNRGVVFNSRMRNQLHCSSSSPSLPPNSSRYQQDGNEVICYYDMSTKYGIGYLLSNGSFGVVFNDQTSLTSLADDYFLYYDRRPLRLSILPESLRKKGDILRLCTEKLGSYREKNVLIAYESQVYAQSFLRLGEMFVMKLSNGVLQFFWTCDVLTVRGFKWVKWRIAREEGEAALASNTLPAPVQQKVAIVREFLQRESERSKRRKAV